MPVLRLAPRARHRGMVPHHVVGNREGIFIIH